MNKIFDFKKRQKTEFQAALQLHADSVLRLKQIKQDSVRLFSTPSLRN